MSTARKNVVSFVLRGGGAPAVVPRTDPLLALARAATRGDPAASATLIMQVAPSMLKTVRAVFGRGHPDIEDVTQDAVIAFLSSLPSFRGGSTVLYYADRVALLTALAARRRARVRDRWSDPRGEPAVELIADDPRASPLAELISNRRREILMRVLDELPGPTAEALALHFILGHTVEEIAGAAGVPANTVWSRLRLGKEAFRSRLERDDELAELVRGAV